MRQSSSASSTTSSSATQHLGFGDNDVCPVCKSDRYLNPNMRLLVNLCYHKMCQECIARKFSHGSAPCPICGKMLRKSNFVEQMFEDFYVDKECRIRKEFRFFNKRQDDFASLKEYNDYLEEVENIIFNLTNGDNIQETEARIEKYKMENRELIDANINKQIKEDRIISQIVEEEKKAAQLLREAEIAEELEEAKERQKEKEQFLADLTSSNQSAETIAQMKVSRIKKSTLNKKNDEKLRREILSTPSELRALLERQRALQRTAKDAEVIVSFDPLENCHELTVEVHLEKHYFDPDSEYLRSDISARAGGLLPTTVYSRSIEAARTGWWQPAKAAPDAMDLDSTA